jgi:hypothetical protein
VELAAGRLAGEEGGTLAQLVGWASEHVVVVHWDVPPPAGSVFCCIATEYMACCACSYYAQHATSHIVTYSFISLPRLLQVP